jgi:hypothetical protein
VTSVLSDATLGDVTFAFVVVFILIFVLPRCSRPAKRVTDLAKRSTLILTFLFKRERFTR